MKKIDFEKRCSLHTVNGDGSITIGTINVNEYIRHMFKTHQNDANYDILLKIIADVERVYGLKE